MPHNPSATHRRRTPAEVETLLDALDAQGNPITTSRSERPAHALRDARGREILRAFFAGEITRDEVHERIDVQPDIENASPIRWFAWSYRDSQWVAE
ncbi:hypothetical protein [Dietzia aurantiaca]|uniref:Uncharacterized protein n=1 Tax=Dietzia aurantiaca TaxID=983873 RepID=A0ABV9PPU3_9ACTN